MTDRQVKMQRILFLFCSLLIAGLINIRAQITVTGKITSATDQEPLPGVNVLIKGTTTGTITDIDGNYSITVPSADATLVFSMVGMISEEVKVENRTVIDMGLIVDIVGLDELVVVGYGTMKKSDIAGSIVSVDGDELTDVKTNNVLEALQGKVPGLDITPTNGRAGSGMDMLIRGKRSLRAESDPLVVVDGIPMGTTVDIDPNDIESIEILKDAASTAIYGSRGANGIILITTKRGVAGTTKAYYNAYYSITDPYQKVPVFDRDSYYKAKLDAYRDYSNIDNWYIDPDPNTVFGSAEMNGYNNNITTDWQDLITRQGFQQDHHLGVTGGTDKVNYNASIAYFDEEGVVIMNQFKRYSSNLNFDVNVNKHLSAGAIVQLTHKILQGANVSSSNYSVFTNAVRLSPMVAPYDSLGNYIWLPATPVPRQSPLATVDDVEEDRRTRIFSNVYTDLMIIEGLNLRSTLGVDYTIKRRGYMYPQKDPESAVTENGVEFRLDGGYTWNNIITFDKTIANLHHFIITAAHEMRYNRIEPYLFKGKEQESERSLWYFMATNKTDMTQESALIEESLVSFLGRINYTFNNKYIVNAAIRYDGASQLAEGHKWDNFPAASVAWRISEESFMENTRHIVTDLKLRLSYGSTGNASIQPYSTFGGLNSWPLYYEFGEDQDAFPVLSFRPTFLTAKSLAWERTNQENLGLDFGLLKNRISGNIDLYYAKTKNILMPDRLPPSTGYFDIYANSAETETKGIELSLQTINVSTKNLTWRTNITFAANREKITKLVSGLEQDIENGWFVGQPIDVFYDFKMTGIRQIGETDTIYGYDSYLPGDIRVADLDGNDTINADDREVIGSERPKWIGTIDNSISFKGLTLSFSIYAKWGHMVDASAYDWDPRMRDNLLAVDYWTPENHSNDFPRLDATFTEIQFESTISYREASFIKLRQITLSYDLPEKWFNNLPLSGLSVYVSSKNTAVLYSKMMKGLDPERGGSVSWPLARFYTFGVNVDF
jgi:TonB-linked SusC/RagA family outer membrane protein